MFELILHCTFLHFILQLIVSTFINNQRNIGFTDEMIGCVCNDFIFYIGMTNKKEIVCSKMEKEYIFIQNKEVSY